MRWQLKFEKGGDLGKFSILDVRFFVVSFQVDLRPKIGA
jgi:hypothetical protein